MQTIKHPLLLQLFMETSFVPRSGQLKQLKAAEELYRLIKPQQRYTYEFVCFKITDFRPKAANASILIFGSDLLSNLPIYILRLSWRIKLHTSEQPYEVLTIEQLSEKLNVSIRTVQRWRQRGLLCRRYIFDDGSSQLGFDLPAVEQFISAHQQLVSKASEFSSVSPVQRAEIISLARRLDSQGSLNRTAVIKKVAQQCSRSIETVRLLLKQAEADSIKPIFSKKHVVLDHAGTAEVFSNFQSGIPVEAIAEKFSKSVSTIYRIINRKRILNLLSTKIEYIPSKQFTSADSYNKILGSSLSVRRSPKGILNSSRQTDFDKFVEAIKKVPALNRQQETELFCRYNFLKYLASEQLKQLDLTTSCGRAVNLAEDYLKQAERLKNLIIEANLKLVIRIASRHTASVNFHDLLSEGNMAVVRSVEKFDYTRGFRFSTYASWAILRSFAKLLGTTAESLHHLSDEQAISEHIKKRSGDVELIETARKSLEQVIDENLTDRERYIIRYHFGLEGTLVKKKRKTLQQLGEEFGITKERVRQIELVALGKLRQSLSPEQFELLMR